MRLVTSRRIAIRQQAGLPDLLTSVLALQQRTAHVLGLLKPHEDTTAAEQLRSLHTRLSHDAHALAELLDPAGPLPAHTTTTTEEPL